MRLHLSPEKAGIPLVRDAAERDLIYAPPDERQRVQRLDTGDIEINEGGLWGVLRPQGFYGPVYNLLDYRPNRSIDIGDGVNDATTVWQDAYSDIPAGAGLYVPWPSNFYKLTDRVTRALPILVRGEFSRIKQTVGSKGGMLITGSEVKFYGIDLEGPQHVNVVGAEEGLQFIGTAGTPLVGTKVIGCKVHGWGHKGIDQFCCNRAVVDDNDLFDNVYAGFMSRSGIIGRASRNHLFNMTGDPGLPIGSKNTYGISITRDEAFDLATGPIPTDWLLTDNQLWDIQWTALDTHGGQRISYGNNKINHCYQGYGIVTCDNQAAVPTYAPKDITIEGGHIESGVTDGSYGTAIVFVGVGALGTPADAATGSISDIGIRGHGKQDNNIGGAILIHNSKALRLSNIRLYEPAPIGINLYFNNFDFVLDGLTVVDVWTTDGAFAAAVAHRNGHNTGSIDNVRVAVGTKSATFVNERGYYISSATGMIVREGPNNNFRSCTTPYVSVGGAEGVTTYEAAITIDGFALDNIAGTVGDTELQRFGLAAGSGRFRPIRPGSVVGILVSNNEARSAGTETIKVFKNTGLAGAAGSQLGTSTAILDGTNTSEKLTTIVRGTCPFLAFDEVYPTYSTSGWTPTTSDTRVALLIVYD